MASSSPHTSYGFDSERFSPTLVAITQDVLHSQQKTSPFLLGLKLLCAPVIAGFNAILFFKESKALARDYFGFGWFGQAIFSFSDSYANFFMSIFTSYALVDMLHHFILLNNGNLRHRQMWHVHLLLLALSVITSLPMIAPLPDKLDQALTLLSNTLLSLYALYEFYIFFRSAEDFSHMIRSVQRRICQQPMFDRHRLTDETPNSILLWLSKNLQDHQALSAASNSSLSFKAQVSALFSVLTVVTPYVLSMIYFMNIKSDDNGFLGVFISNDPLVRKIVAILVGILSNVPFAILCAYFGYGMVYECHEMLSNKYSAARQFYPRLWLLNKLFQIIITTLSWSTPVKLHMDFFGGPDFSGKSAYELFFIYLSAAIIGVGVPFFNMYSTSKVSDALIEAYIGFFGSDGAKSLLSCHSQMHQIYSSIWLTDMILGPTRGVA